MLLTHVCKICTNALSFNLTEKSNGNIWYQHQFARTKTNCSLIIQITINCITNTKKSEPIKTWHLANICGNSYEPKFFDWQKVQLLISAWVLSWHWLLLISTCICICICGRKSIHLSPNCSTDRRCGGRLVPDLTEDEMTEHVRPLVTRSCNLYNSG